MSAIEKTLGLTSREEYEIYLKKTHTRQAEPVPLNAIVYEKLTEYDYDRVGYATLSTESRPRRRPTVSNESESGYCFASS